GKQRLSRRVSAREFTDPEQRHSFGVREQCTQTSLSWKLVYLPEARVATDPGNSVANRTAGTNQRSLCNSEDCRDQALPGVHSRTWREFHCGDALEPLRPQRQFRFGNIARPGGALAQSA